LIIVVVLRLGGPRAFGIPLVDTAGTRCGFQAFVVRYFVIAAICFVGLTDEKVHAGPVAAPASLVVNASALQDRKSRRENYANFSKALPIPRTDRAPGSTR
jgi:hypothetical protein